MDETPPPPLVFVRPDNKRGLEESDISVKRRAATQFPTQMARTAPDDQAEFWANWITPRPVVDRALFNQYNDLRSRISTLPANLVCYEIDQRMTRKLPVGSIGERGYTHSSSFKIETQWVDTEDYDGRVADPKEQPADTSDRDISPPLCCAGVDGQVVLVLPFRGRVFILQPDDKDATCTIVRSFTMVLNDRTYLKFACCVGVYSNGDILICSYYGDQAAVFSQTGEHLRSIDINQFYGGFCTPHNFVIDEYNNTYFYAHDQSFGPPVGQRFSQTNGQCIFYMFADDGRFCRTITIEKKYWQHAYVESATVHQNHLYVVNEEGRLFVVSLATGQLCKTIYNLIEDEVDLGIGGLQFDSHGRALLLSSFDISFYGFANKAAHVFCKSINPKHVIHSCFLDHKGRIWGAVGCNCRVREDHGPLYCYSPKPARPANEK